MRVVLMVVSVVLVLVGPLEAGHRRVDRTITKARTSAVCTCGCGKVGCSCGKGLATSATVQTRIKTRR